MHDEIEQLAARLASAGIRVFHPALTRRYNGHYDYGFSIQTQHGGELLHPQRSEADLLRELLLCDHVARNLQEVAHAT